MVGGSKQLWGGNSRCVVNLVVKIKHAIQQQKDLLTKSRWGWRTFWGTAWHWQYLFPLWSLTFSSECVIGVSPTERIGVALKLEGRPFSASQIFVSEENVRLNTESLCLCVFRCVCRCLNLSAHLKFSLSMRTACYRCLRLLPGRLPRFLSRCGLTDGDGGETSHWCLMILKRRYLLFHFLSLWVSVQEKKKSEFGKQVVSDFLLKGNRDVCGGFYCFGKCFLNFIFPTRKSHLQHYYAVWEREEE